MDAQHEKDIATARSVIDAARDALEQLGDGLDARFGKALDLIVEAPGYVIVTGVGKSGHVGQKIAASLASTGTPSFFLHPTEASHGDLGMIVPGSVVIAISYSGESREMVDVLKFCRSRSIPVIGMTRNPESTLGRLSEIALEMPAVRESCPNGLAPTSSTTMTIALGDALTVAAMDRRGFSREEFGMRHPGGKLGKSLQTVADYLGTHEPQLPSVTLDDSFNQVVVEIAAGRMGCVAVLDDAGAYRGIITDGDLRRAFTAGTLDAPAKALMSDQSTTFTRDQKMSEVVQILTDRRITNGFVLDGEKPVGSIHIKDLLAEGYL